MPHTTPVNLSCRNASSRSCYQNKWNCRLKVLLVKRNIVARHRQQNVADRVTQVS